MLLSTEHLGLHQGDFSVFFQRVAELRDIVDLDFADSNMTVVPNRDLKPPSGRKIESGDSFVLLLPDSFAADVASREVVSSPDGHIVMLRSTVAPPGTRPAAR